MAILAQSSADFALTYNFQGAHILGASRGHLCDSVIFLSLALLAVLSCSVCCGSIAAVIWMSLLGGRGLCIN